MDPPTSVLSHVTLYMEAFRCNLLQVFEGLPDIGNTLYECSTYSTYYTTVLTQSFLLVDRR